MSETTRHAHKLDFIVFGTARSGTTAVAGLLNATEEIFCGIENFDPRADHSKLKMPGGLQRQIKRELSSSTRKRRSLNDLQERINSDRADRFRSFGNKHPRYYERLQGVLNEIGSRKAIMCYRDLSSTAQSYDMRVQAGTFNPGRQGVFAIGDMLLQLKALAVTPDADILVVPNTATFNDWRSVIQSCAEHVLGTSATIVEDRAARVHDRGAQRKTLERPVLRDAELEAISTLQEAGLDAVFGKSLPFLLASERTGFERLISALPTDHVGFIEDIVRKNPDPRVTEFFSKWKTRAENAAL